jgi:hypothetical protein
MCSSVAEHLRVRVTIALTIRDPQLPRRNACLLTLNVKLYLSAPAMLVE